MAEFQFGVKAKAEELIAQGIDVGTPIRDEQWFLENTAIQPTTTGCFWVFKDNGNFTVGFVPFA